MGRSKSESVISWADEVEKEEEEARILEKQKANPFGSARPREVVLQERGIDWRKLDEASQPHSHSCVSAQKEKPLKENIPAASAAQAGGRKQPMPKGGRGREQKLNNVKAAHGSKVPQGPQKSKKRGEIVPHPSSSRYAPRALLPDLSPPTHSCLYNPHVSCEAPKNIQSKKKGIELENVHMVCDIGIEQFQTRLLGHGRHPYIGPPNQHKIVLEHRRAHVGFENGRRNCELMGPPVEAKTPRKSATCEGRQNEGASFAQYLVGLPIPDQKRGATPPAHHNRHGDRRDDHHYYGESFQLQGHCKSRMGGESDQLRNFPGKFVGTMEFGINAGKAETNHAAATEEKTKERTGPTRKYKKRGMVSRSDNSHYHPKRR